MYSTLLFLRNHYVKKLVALLLLVSKFFTFYTDDIVIYFRIKLGTFIYIRSGCHFTQLDQLINQLVLYQFDERVE